MSTKSEGTFITFEGGDGAGKTTHIRFLAETLRAHGYEVVCIREPGNTAIGEKLRDIVLDPSHGEMADMCELFIYEAARAQLVSEVIKPALDRGAIVLCDRFTDSTYAYQAVGRGLDAQTVRDLNHVACQGVYPERTIVMIPPSVADGLHRATKDDGADRLEGAGMDFHARVNNAFKKMADEHPRRMRAVYSEDKKSETSKRVFEALKDLFPWMSDLLHDDAYFEPLNTRKHKTVE